MSISDDELDSSPVTVLRVEVSGRRCLLSVDDGGRGIDFDLTLEEHGGIRVLTGIDPLTRWLMGCGKLWAQRPLCELAAMAISGDAPEIPIHLEFGKTLVAR